MNAPPRCIPCERRVEHPWHDDGTRNKWSSAQWEDWRRVNGGPRHMDEIDNQEEE